MLINISSMKIYFAGAIRGGRNDADLYQEIIAYLENKGQVLTEHVGSTKLTIKGEITRKDNIIYERDMDWLKNADVVVAEVTTPSLGVGYELGIAERLEKPTICLYRPSENKRLSAMVKGNKIFTCRNYNGLIEAKLYIDEFLKQLI